MTLASAIVQFRVDCPKKSCTSEPANQNGPLGLNINAYSDTNKTHIPFSQLFILFAYFDGFRNRVTIRAWKTVQQWLAWLVACETVASEIFVSLIVVCREDRRGTRTEISMKDVL